MDAVGQSYNIVVTGAHDNAGVPRYLGVQSDKVAPIKGHKRSTSRSRKR